MRKEKNSSAFDELCMGMIDRDLPADALRKDRLLLEACGKKQWSRAAAMLSAGADPNAESFEGWLPIHKAASACDLPMMGALARAGANLNARVDGTGATPLLCALEGPKERRMEVARFLLERGASPDTLSFVGSGGNLFRRNVAPLAHCCMEGEVEGAGLLLEFGAKADIASARGLPLLHDVLVHGFNPELAGLLAGAGLLEARDESGCTALNFCAKRGLSQESALLAKLGADVETRNNAGETPLMSACRYCGASWLAVELALMGADVAARSDSGMTPLHYAMAAGRADVAKVLIERGADGQAKDKAGNTPFDAGQEGRLSDKVLAFLRALWESAELSSASSEAARQKPSARI